jgi:hypothetical protein
MNCRVCQTRVLPFFSLGAMPLVNRFLKADELRGEKRYDLTVGFCPSCYLAQLTETVSPEILFRNYLYFSSVSSSFLEHCKQTAKDLTSALRLNSKSLVLEIASNDGVLLQFFQALGIPVLGVDPAENIAKEANERGIPTIPEFFSAAFANRLVREKNIAADLVYGANVLAHVPEIVDFVQGVQTVLQARGTAVFEFPYVKGLMENKFDTIYQEHVFYYSLLALQNLFLKAGLEIYRVHMLPVQGGSLRIFAGRAGIFPVEESVRKLEKKEREEKFDSVETYRKIAENVRALKEELRSLILRLKGEGKRIAAYSAPAKGMILLNYFGIGKEELDFIVDKSGAKQGLYTPGTHMLIYPPEKIFKERPDYVLVLCWNIAQEVMREMEQYQKNGGKFIVPIPRVRVL